MAPGYLGLDIGYEYKPNDDLLFFFSPIAGKTTFVMDKYLSGLGAFGVEAGKETFSELGASFRTGYKKESIKNIKIQTFLHLFSSYNNNFGNVDIIWDFLLLFKITKYINTTIITGLIYNDDIDYIDPDGVNHGPKIQFKEIIGVGLTFNLGNK